MNVWSLNQLLSVCFALMILIATIGCTESTTPSNEGKTAEGSEQGGRDGREERKGKKGKPIAASDEHKKAEPSDQGQAGARSEQQSKQGNAHPDAHTNTSAAAARSKGLWSNTQCTELRFVIGENDYTDKLPNDYQIMTGEELAKRYDEHLSESAKALVADMDIDEYEHRRKLLCTPSSFTKEFDVKLFLFRDKVARWPGTANEFTLELHEIREWPRPSRTLDAPAAVDLFLVGEYSDEGFIKGKVAGRILILADNDILLFFTDVPFQLRPIRREEGRNKGAGQRGTFYSFLVADPRSL